MSMILKRNVEKVENTPKEWVDYKDGVQFEIKGISDPLFQKAQTQYTQRLASQDLLNISENSLDAEMQIAIIGRYLVTDWVGIKDENNEDDAEYSYENFVALFLNYPDVVTFVLEKSAQIQLDFHKTIESTKKKPSNTTHGKKTTQN